VGIGATWCRGGVVYLALVVDRILNFVASAQAEGYRGQWRWSHCRTLIKSIGLRRAKPGLGPAAEILSFASPK